MYSISKIKCFYDFIYSWLIWLSRLWRFSILNLRNFTESNILANSWTYLNLHIFIEFSVEIFSISQNDKHVYNDKKKHDKNECSSINTSYLISWHWDIHVILEFSACSWFIIKCCASSFIHIIRGKPSS